MNRFQKYMSIGLVGIMLLAFSACGSSDSDSANKILPKVELANKKVVMLTQGESEAKTFNEVYGGEVEQIVVADSELSTKFISMVMGDEAPDVYQCYFQPSLVAKDYLLKLTDKVDFTSDLWKDALSYNELLKYKGDYYSLVPFTMLDSYVFYNTELFEENSVTTPQQLLEEGNWNWNTFRETALKLTVDTNRDGVPDIWGGCIDQVDLFMYSCGKHAVSFNPDGKAINNIQSEEVARSINFYVNIMDNDLCIYSGLDNITKFTQGEIAMFASPIWKRIQMGDMLKNKTIGIVPFPKDPDADTTYMMQGTYGYVVPAGAKNVDGAIAYINSKRYEGKVYEENGDPEELAKMEQEYGWGQYYNDLVKANLKLANAKGVPNSYISFNITELYGEIFARPRNGEPWATIAAEISPLIDDRINIAYGE